MLCVMESFFYFESSMLDITSCKNVLRVADQKLALKGVPDCLAVTVEQEESVSLSFKEYKKREERRAQERRRERRGEERKGEERRGDERREESRPIRAPRQGDLCLIRRSRLAEAVRTGIHIRYGLGSGFTLDLVFLARIRPQQPHRQRQLSQHRDPRSPSRAGPLDVKPYVACLV